MEKSCGEEMTEKSVSGIWKCWEQSRWAAVGNGCGEQAQPGQQLNGIPGLRHVCWAGVLGSRTSLGPLLTLGNPKVSEFVIKGPQITHYLPFSIHILLCSFLYFVYFAMWNICCLILNVPEIERITFCFEFY